MYFTESTLSSQSLVNQVSLEAAAAAVELNSYATKIEVVSGPSATRTPGEDTG